MTINTNAEKEDINDTEFTFHSKKLDLMSTFIKENTTVFLIVPTVIGAIIQLFNLYIIDPYLIRFFSLTQLISDGLWILLIFLPLYFLIPIALLFLSPSNYSMCAGTKEDETGIKIVNFFQFFGIVVFTYFVITKEMNWLLWLMIASCIMSIKINSDANKAYTENKSFEKWKIFFYLAFIISTIAFIYTLSLNKSMPKKIANFQIVENKVLQSFPNYKQNILYMNDIYIFSKVYCDSINEKNSKIVILKIDDMFE